MTPAATFGHEIAALAATGCDAGKRPPGSALPRYPKVNQPLDYAYLEGPTPGDDTGMESWLGSPNHMDKC
jgi:hypothetical protein